MCEYCSNTRFKLKKCKLKIEQTINCYKNDTYTNELLQQEIEININYCPMCGRKLGE